MLCEVETGGRNSKGNHYIPLVCPNICIQSSCELTAYFKSPFKLTVLLLCVFLLAVLKMKWKFGKWSDVEAEPIHRLSVVGISKNWQIFGVMSHETET